MNELQKELSPNNNGELPNGEAVQTLAQKFGVNMEVAKNATNEWQNASNVLNAIFDKCSESDNFQIDLRLISVAVCVKNDDFSVLKEKGKAKTEKGLKIFTGTMQEQGSPAYIESLYLLPKFEVDIDGEKSFFYSLANFNDFVSALSAASFTSTFEISEGTPYKNRKTFELKEI